MPDALPFTQSASIKAMNVTQDLTSENDSLALTLKSSWSKKQILREEASNSIYASSSMPVPMTQVTITLLDKSAKQTNLFSFIWIFIWMVLQSKFAIRFLNIIKRSSRSHSQQIIIGSLLHRSSWHCTMQSMSQLLNSTITVVVLLLLLHPFNGLFPGQPR